MAAPATLSARRRPWVASLCVTKTGHLSLVKGTAYDL
jgi:hypothetical protein